MDRISEKVVDGVAELRFELAAAGEKVPGIRWSPEGQASPAITILMGHGGYQSKEAPNIVAMARSMARERGWATIALDAPAHGDRRTEEQIRQQESGARRRRAGAGTAAGAGNAATTARA